MRLHWFTFVLMLLCLMESAAIDDHPKLLLGNRMNIQVIESMNPSSAELIIDDIEYTMSCDYIYSDNLIFWVDASAKEEKIQSVFTNVSYHDRVKRDVISTGLEQPDGLACDWIGKKLYWTDAEANHIEVSELDGRTRTVLIWDKLDQPRAIVVDPLKGYLYWSDWGENPKIERAGMDGSDRKALVERDGIYWPNGLTIDYEEEKVYWVDANYHYINRMNTDGSGREVVVSSGPFNAGDNTGNYESGSDALSGLLQNPFSITLSGNRIYWTDWATNSIHSAVKNGTGQNTVIKDNISSLHDIHSYGQHRQKKGVNPCGSNNGGCSHLCLISPNPPYFSCACRTGVQLKADKKTCKDGPENILLLARRPDIRVLSLDKPDFSDIVLPLTHVEHSVAIDYDPVEGMVYWSSNHESDKAIFRVKLDGTGEEKIISDEVEQCDGIAIDWVARNIYWSEAERHYIAVSRLNGSSRKVIIEDGIDSPRAIALDPAEGQMYWSDWRESKIERASMDGSDRHVFVNSSIHWPNGLAIDYKRRLLYWAEAYLDKIEVIGLNGNNRRVLLEEKIPHIFGFSYLDDYLYWSDWEKRKVERMLVYDRKSRHSMIDELPDLMGIKASGVVAINATNPCANNNGECSHLCLYTPKGVRCQCPDGQELLSDMRSCIEPEAFLLFTMSADGVHRISLETALSASVEVPLKRGIDATDIDISVQMDLIFWTDLEHKAIFRANMNGTDVRSIINDGVGTLEGIAVDWIGNNIYWTDSDSNRIEMARLDGSDRMAVVLQDLDAPSSMAVDATNGYIYWSEWGGGRPKIRRAEMDGSHVATLLGNGIIGRAHSLTIDHKSTRLYWVDLDTNEIVSSNMTGGDRKQIIAGEEKSIFSIALYHDYIFWTVENAIERANKSDGSGRMPIQKRIIGPSISDMLVYHASRQTGVTACAHENGGCQHICLATPGGGYKCACPAHHRLNKDNLACIAPDDFLLYANEDEISRIIFDRGTTGRQIPDAVLSLGDLEDVIAIDYDSFTNHVVWIDKDGMHKARMNGTEGVTLLHRNGTKNQPFDLTVDPYNRMLYWTDEDNNSINAMRLNGSIIGEIIGDSVRLVGEGVASKKTVKIMPRKIAVWPENGIIFFSSTCLSNDDNCRELILKSYVDGSDVIKIIGIRLLKVSGLVVDRDKQRLYWCDEGMGKIESSMLDGSDRKVFQSNLLEPHGLAIFGVQVYWIDKTPGQELMSLWQIEAAKKFDQQKERRKMIKGSSSDIKDLVGVSKFNKRGLSYHCSTNYGSCSHICVGKEDGSVTCSCPTHLSKVSNQKCGEAPTCSIEHFTCSGKEPPECVPENWRCDGENDCKDASDELHCPPCQSKDRFQCGTGVGDKEGATARDVNHVGRFLNVIQGFDATTHQCVSMKQRCDGKADCVDHSDELNCPCSSQEFSCSNGKCIPKHEKCDGIDDCGDNSDEKCSGVTSTAQTDQTVVIAIISSVLFVTIIVAVAVISFRKKKPRNRDRVTVGGVYKKSGNLFRLDFKITHHEGVEHVEHDGSELQTARPANFNQAGPSTASVNVSLTADRGPRVVPSEMPRQDHQHSMIPGPHQICGIIQYPGASDSMLRPHWPRPNIPGASSSTSSGRGHRQFLPTLNPPPSPATDRSGSKTAGEGHCSTDSQSVKTVQYNRCRGRHRRRPLHHNHPYVPVPHPTPCASDSYDDGVSYSGTSVRDFDSISWRSKSAGAPSSPPPPYCHCCHHVCHAAYMGCNGAYHPYPPSSYQSSHRGYHTPPLPHELHHHSSSSSGSIHFGPQECSAMCCSRTNGRQYYSGGRKTMRGPSANRPPPRYSYDMNSDSDPFAPPPTPRSQYLSDYCCTHDEGEENQDDEGYLDVIEKEVKEVSQSSEKTRHDAAGDSNNDARSTNQKCQVTPDCSEAVSDEEKSAEDQPLLTPCEAPMNTAEIEYPILNPPPSPVTDSS